MTVLLADTRLPSRQVLIRGRVGEAITGRSYEDFHVLIEAEQGPTTCALPVTVANKPGGWYVAHLGPRGTWPVFAEGVEVTLRVTITLAGREPQVLSEAVEPSALQLATVDRSLGEQEVTTTRIAGAPFTFDLTVDPLPVSLKGMVIRNHDPADPLAGVTVTADASPPVQTDARGQFFIPALPVAEAITLALTGGGDPTNVNLIPDYARRVNTVTISLSGA